MAKRLGANAVVDIVSYYKKVETKSPTKYECHSGNIIVGVTLKGTYAKVCKRRDAARKPNGSRTGDRAGPEPWRAWTTSSAPFIGETHVHSPAFLPVDR